MCTPAGELPDSVGCMTALTVLTMAQNQLVGEIPEGVGNLPQLTMLLLSHNQLSGDNSSRSRVVVWRANVSVLNMCV
jgi:Leucine-rich repeat (LRR) protein